MGNQCMKTIEKDFILSATANSKEEAFSKIFVILRRRIYQEISGVIIHMEPKEVYLLEDNIEKYTEKFLWLFMPREKAKYTIKAKIVVEIKYIDT